VLSTAPQPIWVVDRDGVIRFANPAAIEALGYDSADELVGRHSHETIHHSHADGTPYPAAECPMLLPRLTGETVSRDLDWFFRRDDSMFPVSYVSAPIEMREGRGAVVCFTDIEDRLRAERELRERDDLLAGQQASLRRIAALVAGGAASADVFAAIAREVGQVIALPMVALWRYDPPRTATVIGEWSERPHPFRVGTSWPLDGPTICAKVLDTGLPSRIEDFGDIPGTIAGAARETGIGSCAGAPIIVDGQVWGAMSADTFDRAPLAEGLEDRLAQFTELVATAISNSASREALVRLADEQAALRRVATLVAHGVPPGDLFEAVAREVGMLLGGDATHVGRFDADGTATLIASWVGSGERIPVGTVAPLDGENVCSLVLQTGRPARMSAYECAAGPIAAMLRQLGIRSSVGAPIVVDGRQWGVTIVSSKAEEPLAPDTEERLLAFTELVATAISNSEARAVAGRLTDEQAALRRVATLVARSVSPIEVFEAVAREAGQLLGVDAMHMGRYDDGAAISVAGWSHGGDHLPVGTRVELDGTNVASLVFQSGRPARIDGYSAATGASAERLRHQMSVYSSVAVPIVVDDRLWGLMIASSKQPQPLPADVEARLLGFTELVGTAVANAQARAEVARLADEQAALRRVATLVARECPPEEVFAAVAGEVGRLLPVEDTAMLRYDDDDAATVVATWGKRADELKVGTRMPIGGENLTTRVRRTGRPARIDDYAASTGAVGTRVGELGVGSAVGCPIVVDERLWGIMVASQGVADPLPAETEARVRKFAELVATAISNVQARSELAASRARIVAATDDERRRVVRDLHDGAQQRLVHTIVTLKLAQDRLDAGRESAPELVGEALDHAQQAIADLRELSQGILPTVLTRGGLSSAVKALASRMPVPIKVAVPADRLPAVVEATAYFVVAEALTNIAKHAHATRATVLARIDDGVLEVEVGDDGIGGARPDGSGLVGLADRLAALDGHLRVESPDHRGTLVVAEIPLPGG
jgi:PAS domain S-box-containing protein